MTDDGPAPLTVTADSGSGPVELPLTGGAFTYAGGPFASNGQRTVTFRACDGLSNCVAVNRTITVNSTPVVDAGADSTITAGSTLSGTASFTDSGDPGPWTVTVDYGVGSPAVTTSTGGSITLSRAYPTAGSYNVSVTVCDALGACGSDARVVTVRPAGTAPTFSLGSSASMPTGKTYWRTMSFADPDGGPWTVQVDYGAGAGFQSVPHVLKTFIIQRTYNTAGTYNVRVRVCDATSLCTTQQITLTVAANVTAQPLVPIALCANRVGANRLGVWNYTNPNVWIVTVAVGTANRFQPNPQNRSQTTTFLPGTWPGAATSQPQASTLTWQLNGNSASITPSTPACL